MRILVLLTMALALGCSEGETAATPERPRAEPPPEADPEETPSPPEPAGTDEPDPRIARANRAVRERDYAGAITLLDGVIADHPNHARAFGLRGYSRLFVRGAEARRAARVDLERALRLASEPRLQSSIQFNLGLLEDREGHGDEARAHYTRANELRASDIARRHAEGHRDCSVHIATEESPRDIAPSWSAARLLAQRAGVDADALADLPELDEDTFMCGDNPCTDGELHVALQEHEGSWRTHLFVPLSDGRVRVVPVVGEAMQGSCEDQCSGEIVTRAPAFHARVTCLGNAEVEQNEQGEPCSYDEGEECMTGCLWDSRADADVIVDPATGRAVIVRHGSGEVLDDVGDGGIAAYLEVDVETTDQGVHVRGCGIDRTVPLAAH